MDFHEHLSLVPLLAAGIPPEGPLNFLYTMKGPDFLVIYLGWFFALFTGVVILRALGFGNWRTTLGGLFLYEGLGIARYIAASSMGMHKFEFLFMGMFFGMFFFIFRFKTATGDNQGGGVFWVESNGGGGGSGGCGSSSCGGGGGCGGGGCGGCGGG